mmetsp:Transcript_11754/g.30166  ORF Transcript_11754/g.30166 Transcript_11754/m.30166 type:complete len:260 (-) Transcript_11754:690-1469(-)
MSGIWGALRTTPRVERAKRKTLRWVATCSSPALGPLGSNSHLVYGSSRCVGWSSVSAVRWSVSNERVRVASSNLMSSMPSVLHLPRSSLLPSPSSCISASHQPTCGASPSARSTVGGSTYEIRSGGAAVGIWPSAPRMGYSICTTEVDISLIARIVNPLIVFAGAGSWHRSILKTPPSAISEAAALASSEAYGETTSSSYWVTRTAMEASARALGSSIVTERSGSSTIFTRGFLARLTHMPYIKPGCSIIATQLCVSLT